MLLETINHVRINTIQCWNTELFKFINEEECNALTDIVDRRDELIKEINQWYDTQHGWYGKCMSNDDATDPEFSCGGPQNLSTRPFVFLNTILKRLKRLFDSMDIKPIYGVGTAKIALDWILQPEDYWDTFTCLSFQPDANQGEIFNVTQIVAGECANCPPELVREVTCSWQLYILVKELTELMVPLISEEQLHDKTCDRKCCDATDPNYVRRCITQESTDFDELFWGIDGAGAGDRASDFCERYSNALCIPLYISWKDGAHWPNGGITP
jgi:hypothetical protein